MTYKCLKKENYRFEEYCLTSLREQDIYPIRVWRNEQMNILRQKREITIDEQSAYFEFLVMPGFDLKQPRNILLSFLMNEQLIGYGGLVHIDWESKRAEVSFLLDTMRSADVPTHQKEFAIFLDLLEKIAFEDLELNKLHTEVFNIRPWHIEVIEDKGFKKEGVLREHVKINGKYVDSIVHSLLRKEWEQSRS